MMDCGTGQTDGEALRGAPTVGQGETQIHPKVRHTCKFQLSLSVPFRSLRSEVVIDSFYFLSHSLLRGLVSFSLCFLVQIPNYSSFDASFSLVTSDEVREQFLHHRLRYNIAFSTLYRASHLLAQVLVPSSTGPKHSPRGFDLQPRLNGEPLRTMHSRPGSLEHLQ